MQPPMRSGHSDHFQTPAIALEPLLSYLPKGAILWEPAAGKGNLVQGLRKAGWLVISSDILTGQNFLTWKPHIEWDCIVTNPPFTPKLKQAFLERAYYLGKPFAMLFPLTALEGQKRQALYRKHGLELVLFDRRINFETPSGNGSGAWFAVAWFTWGLNIGRQLTFTQSAELREAAAAIRAGLRRVEGKAHCAECERELSG